MSITHYDLFAGIGGFSLALEEVFTNEEIKHIFCEWEQFPTAVLKQHWPEAEYWGNITELVAHTNGERLEVSGQRSREGHDGTRNRKRLNQTQDWTIVTGGFPCQPFSHAGRRKGTADNRYQWPNMFEVIRNVKPDWVIAENVRGLVTWNEGMVLEQVCSDLESEGYEVQPFIIPAVAVNAPHRRDRVWIIAHTSSDSNSRALNGVYEKENGIPQEYRSERGRAGQLGGTNLVGKQGASSRLQDSRGFRGRAYPDWSRNWQEVAFATCNDAMDDGIPRLVDGVPQSFAKWRQNSLKAYGNGIVMQVAVEIMKAIKAAEVGQGGQESE